jgi:hypothetical protein
VWMRFRWIRRTVIRQFLGEVGLTTKPNRDKMNRRHSIDVSDNELKLIHFVRYASKRKNSRRPTKFVIALKSDTIKWREWKPPNK